MKKHIKKSIFPPKTSQSKTIYKTTDEDLYPKKFTLNQSTEIVLKKSGVGNCGLNNSKKSRSLHPNPIKQVFYSYPKKAAYFHGIPQA